MAPALFSCSLIDGRQRLQLRIKLRADGQQRVAAMRAQFVDGAVEPFLFLRAAAPARQSPQSRNARPSPAPARQAASGSQGSRVEATVPVRLGTLSATCSRARPWPGAISPRALAQAAACMHLMRPGPEQIVIRG